MSYQKQEEQKPSPFRPFIGFLFLIGSVTFSFLVSGSVVKWLTTTNLTLGGLGWPILPIVFPDTWPVIVPQLVITLVLSMILLTVATIIVLPFLKPPGSPLDVREPMHKKKRKRRR
ncbi:MAG TPA: hypothetical protein ENI95_12515 [Chloroflexi bacterium]|nr:hypothetical protein [Chloroflexota bacterium]